MNYWRDKKGQIKQLQAQNKLLKQGIIDDAEIATVLVPRELWEQLQAENEKLRHRIKELEVENAIKKKAAEELFDTGADLLEGNEKLKKALRANIKYCEYYDGKKRCGEIAVWGVFDYDGWAEYYCDKHKNHKTANTEPKKLDNQILAEQALKDSK